MFLNALWFEIYVFIIPVAFSNKSLLHLDILSVLLHLSQFEIKICYTLKETFRSCWNFVQWIKWRQENSIKGGFIEGSLHTQTPPPLPFLPHTHIHTHTYIPFREQPYFLPFHKHNAFNQGRIIEKNWKLMLSCLIIY